jgi:hypothetical protein
VNQVYSGQLRFVFKAANPPTSHAISNFGIEFPGGENRIIHPRPITNFTKTSFTGINNPHNRRRQNMT